MHAKSRLDELFSGPARAELEARLREYVQPRRWFRSKSRAVAGVSIDHVVRLPTPAEERDGVFVLILGVDYEGGGERDAYAVPVTWVQGDAGAHLAQTRPHLVVGAVEVEGEERPRWLVDALGERRALEGLLALVARGATVEGQGCSLVFRPVGDGVTDAGASPRAVETEQSNTSVVYGDACILKVVRKVDDGASPDLEMSEFLTRAGYAHTPRLLAAIELVRPARPAATAGVVHAFVPNEGDAWTFTLGTIAVAYARAGQGDAAAEGAAFVAPLARRIAEMHAALARPTPDPRFLPETLGRAEREAIGGAAVRALDAVWVLAGERAERLPGEAVARFRALRGRERAVRACVDAFVGDAGTPLATFKTRVHGDLHLGQVLVTGTDFHVIDFEGEPARPLAERKAKRSPAVDVAGMLRSLHYASVAAERDRGVGRLFAAAWYEAARRAFLRAYDEAAASRTVLPEDPAQRAAFLRFYSLEKCVYELRYELDNRPDWVMIPLLGLESLLEEADAA